MICKLCISETIKILYLRYQANHEGKFMVAGSKNREDDEEEEGGGG